MCKVDTDKFNLGSKLCVGYPAGSDHTIVAEPLAAIKRAGEMGKPGETIA